MFAAATVPIVFDPLRLEATVPIFVFAFATVVTFPEIPETVFIFVAFEFTALTAL